MVETSLASRIVSFLAVVKLIPGLKSTLLDWLGVLVWMVVVALASGGRLYFVIDYMTGIREFADRIMATIMIILIPLYTMLTFPLLAYAVGKTQDLVNKPNLPRPKNITHFSVMMILTCCVVAYSLFFILNSPKSLGTVIAVCMLIYAPSTIVLNFVIGVAAHNLIKKVCREEAEKEENLTVQDSTITQLTEEFQEMKTGFSPFLFLFYSMKCALFVAVSYDLGKLLFNAVATAATCLELSYVTFVLDDVYLSFKSLKQTLKKRALVCNDNELRAYKKLIYQIEAEDAFSGLGFFKVDRSILTRLAATIFTYTIINNNTTELVSSRPCDLPIPRCTPSD